MSRKRTRNKRTRTRRNKEGAGGAQNRPSRTGETQRTDISQRVDASYNVLGHPQSATLPRAQEGTHYEVLAYTDWADSFIPTVIKWNHGEVDDLTDKSLSMKNREKALGRGYLKDAHHVTKPAEAQIKYKGKTFVEHTGAYSRSEAERKAEDIQERGYWTIIHETGLGYTVYAARKELHKPADSIQTSAGEAYFVRTEHENEAGRWKDDYWTRDGYYVIHRGKQHHIYKVKPGKPYVVELWSNQDDAVYKVNVVANSLADAEAEGSLILRERYPGHGSDVTAYTEES